MQNWLLDKFYKIPEKLAVSDSFDDYSYQDLLNEITSLTKELDFISKGSVVAICSDYSFQSISMFLALAVKKCIIVPITNTKDNEISIRLQESYADYKASLKDSKWHFESLRPSCSHNFIDTLRQKFHSGLILFSSGITGKPKAMVHDLDQLLDSYKDKNQKKIVFLVFLMFDHIGGVNTMLNALSMGSHMVLPENRDAEHVCNLIEKYKVNVLPASPSFLNLLLINDVHRKYNLKSLRLITYGTEAMPDSLLSKVKQALPKVKLLQTFGTSETGIARTFSQTSDSTFFKIDDPNVEYKIEDGELLLKSGTQVLGYLNVDKQAFDEQGWFHTGDLVEQTDDGYIKIIGRNKEVINVGGEKVLPAEVESVLGEMDEIADCVVYGEQNSITGQHVSVDIVLTGWQDKREIKKKIRNYCKAKLDNYKVPAKLYFVNKINLNPNCKKSRR